MYKKFIFIYFILIFISLALYAQKPALNHSVYDGWKSVSKQSITKNGNYAVYNINPQEGDGSLLVANTKSNTSFTVARGYNQQITPNQQHVVFLIKPTFADTRRAKIQKSKPDEMPKDSLGILKFGTQRVFKMPYVKSYKMGKDTSEYLAYISTAPADTTGGKKEAKRDKDQGYSLIIRSLANGQEDTIQNVVDYIISNNGKYLAATLQPNSKDSLAKAGVMLYNLSKKHSKFLLSGKGTYKQPVFSENGMQLAFIANRDTSSKTEPKIFDLYYYKHGIDSAIIIADKTTNGMPQNWSVGEEAKLEFSKNGQNLFFGIAPILPAKDTTIVDFEVAKLDIWHWAEPDLQPMQLKNRDKDLTRTYMAVMPSRNFSKIIPLANEKMKNIYLADEGNAAFALGLDDSKYRIEMQWEGFIRNDVYAVSLTDGNKTMVVEGIKARPSISATGKYITWYDLSKQHWYAYSIETKNTVCLTDKINVNFWDEKHDTPSEPDAYGLAAWLENDSGLLLYDAYDIWQVDPAGLAAPVNLTAGEGRKSKITFRYIKTDTESRFITANEQILLSAFDNTSKMNGFYSLNLAQKKNLMPVKDCTDAYTYSKPVKAKSANAYIYTKGNFNTFPDLYITENGWKTEKKLTDACPQMKDYNWGTVELLNWKTDNGITADGLLYKPDDFDAAKKYPMIVYFYEKHSDALYRYFSPAPSRSTVNIPFYTSRGYLVFTPDIYYEDGYPGKSAYKSIVPGVRSLYKNPWVDTANVAIQGQSWGGYQVAYLITQTNMFKAAGAGAPVVNMTSAYGGIRWGTGLNRQFQYEHTQSRIGKTLWDGFDLYIENSPLFFADKVETPLLIMHNDNDGAVPWYQGIEYFTALRRLGKKVWMLQYNDEGHNLLERKNAKDLSIRLQQFFDHYLKGDKVPEWMKYGVPATKKGITWGYNLVD